MPLGWCGESLNITVAEISDGQLVWLADISSYRLLPLGFNLIQTIINTCDECNISATVTDNWTDVKLKKIDDENKSKI